MNATQWTGIAGLGALAATVGMTWNYIRTAFQWASDIFICRAIITNDAAEAVMAMCWHQGRRSPFGLRLFSGGSSWVQPAKRVQLIAFENISSDPILFWLGRAPAIVCRQKGTDSTTTATEPMRTVFITFIRGTINLDRLIIGAVENYNHIKQGTNGCAKRRRFSIDRLNGDLGRDDSWHKSPGTYANSSPPISERDSLHEQLVQRTLRLLQWRPEDLVSVTPNQSPFHGYAFPSEVLASIDEMKLWLENEQWFRSKSIPWRRGWLLHGPPGCGKSTLIRAVAMMFDLPVFTIDLSTHDNHSFVDAWSRLSSSAPAIALIEDIDAVFSGRENVSATNTTRDALTFDCLLNCISGVGNSDGTFLIVTTNRPETLDPALGIVRDGKSTRPGRIDRVIELGFMQQTERVALATHILEGHETEQALAVTAGEGMTPAQFQDHCAQRALRLFWTNRLTPSPDAAISPTPLSHRGGG